ncbi:PQQ-dependent dehydrogenase, methanol/ethanol family [Sphingomonas sp. TX0543]|uniref:PQQ-dependent dehydrogenase, methanol/ethanol family n=1 Tax=unclassified Sphingomonas TaxID=196159 RepID=UPI0010F80E7D|nr:PQQ-dependent dehydrogenase, methanol/ethanol family [Sphingomonas sp. 3P27F8]
MPMRTRLMWLTLTPVAVALAACADPVGQVPAPAAGSSLDTPSDWLGHGRDYQETSFSPLQQIDNRNVAGLKLAFSVDLPDESLLEATPLAVNGTLYFSGGQGNVYAVDGATGEMRWTFDAQAADHMGPDSPRFYGANRGVAYLDGKVFVATKDARMIAIDAKTGQQLWSTSFRAPGTVATSSGAPRAFNNLVIIGNSGAEFGARGYVTAMDTTTGKIVWRFFTVPGNPAVDKDETTQIASKTWSGEWWKYGGGGTPWNGLTYDRELDTVYIGAGNVGPYDYPHRQDGRKDNLFVNSIVAVDAKTGKYKWHFQYNPLEAWDWKATSEMILTDLTIDGVRRKVVMQTPSNGFLYVIDRTNGQLISAGAIGKQNWADGFDRRTKRPIEREDIRYEKAPRIMYPGVLGAHDWQTISYNPQTGLLYIPTHQIGAKFSRPPEALALVKETKGSFASTGQGVLWEFSIDPKDPRDGKGALVAWDPVQQKPRWTVNYPFAWAGGTATTAGNLVFQGTQDGYLIAYDASTGQQLWRYNVGLGVVAAPIAYAVGKRQFVALLVGWGGAAGEGGDFFQAGWKFGAQPRRLVVFALDGKATLPPTAPPDFSMKPVDVAGLKLDPATVQQGALNFALNCGYCHGANAKSLGGAPELRESAAAADMATLKMIVQGGALASRGMPKFHNMSDEKLQTIYQYIRFRARETVPKD